MMTQSNPNAKKVVIVGGGFAGAYVAQKLEKEEFNVTLIDCKDYFEYTPGILRTIVQPDHIKKIQRLHQQYLKQTKVIHGEVSEVTEQDVVLGKQRIPFDYLVASSGSTYNVPIKQNVIFATRGTTLRNYYEKLSQAKTVLIIGGGIVGIELAAEIVTQYYDKHVILVHSHDVLMPRMPTKAQEYAHSFLKKRGVEFVFSERIVEGTGTTYATKSGKRIAADLAFLCTGITPNTEFFFKNFRDRLDEKNQVYTSVYLQMKGHENIFAAGDITAIPEEKTAQNAEEQAKVIAHNISALEKKQPLKQYESKPRTMVISLGPWNGILTYKNFALTGFIPAFLKWFVEWKTMRRYG